MRSSNRSTQCVNKSSHVCIHAHAHAMIKPKHSSHCVYSLNNSSSPQHPRNNTYLISLPKNVGYTLKRFVLTSNTMHFDKTRPLCWRDVVLKKTDAELDLTVTMKKLVLKLPVAYFLYAYVYQRRVLKKSGYCAAQLCRWQRFAC